MLLVLILGILGLSSASFGQQALLTPANGAALHKAFTPAAGWTVQDNALVGESPEYQTLPAAQPDGFIEDSWTYYTVHPINLWRHALAGKKSWTNYSFACTVQIEKPAPLKGPRIGETFFNYQWGREAIGSDAGIIVRYQGPDDYYMVRLSSMYHHVELWKTHGGVVRVVPFQLDAQKSYQVTVTAAGRWLSVAIDGKILFSYADPVEPLLTGQVGLGVRESRVRFSDIRVQQAAANDAPLPSHVPDFHVRKWVGRDYIFDGDEPVAFFHWIADRGMELGEVKLTPGLMPLVMPHAGVELYDYTPGGDLKITGEGKTCAFTVAMGRKDTYAVNSQWEVSYDPAHGYTWDKQVRVTALKDKPLPSLPPVEDLYFYQLVSPMTDKLPKCLALPNWSIAEVEGGKIEIFPNSGALWRDGLADSAKSPVKPDGCFVSTIDGWGVACQFPADNALRYTTGRCHWGLDAHMSGHGQVPAKGGVYAGHTRVYLWDKARVATALKNGVPPVQVGENPPELLRHVEPLNKCDQLSPGMNGEPVRLWTGKYTIDHTTGHGDKVCMRIDAAQLKTREDKPNIVLGPSFWTGPFLAPRYRFSMYVKAENYTGQVSLLADSFVIPDGKKIDPATTKNTLTINGKTGWTKVAFESDFPRKVYNWTLRIDAAGTGVLWVDDLEITPLTAAK